MNKQEAIKCIENGDTLTIEDKRNDSLIDMVIKSDVLAIISQIDEPKKPAVPQVAVDYYEEYKHKLSAFDEWFGDFFSNSFLEDFPRGDKLSEWLYDNNDETNRQRELALATLIVNGLDAVEVEQEKKYRVRMKNTPSYLFNSDDGWCMFNHDITEPNVYTKSEIVEAGFGWVFDCKGVEVKEVE